MNAWASAVRDNAGPESAHGRCPAYAGATFQNNAFYTNCEKQIMAAALDASHTCDPTAHETSCSALSIHDGAVWDIMSWLHSLAHGHDGALRWAMAEKPWVIGAQCNTWVGDYTAPNAAGTKAFDSYISASKWGSTWYDGSPTGRLKPIALSTRFLSQYLAVTPYWTDPTKYNMTYVELASSSLMLGGGYRFIGPDCVFVGGPSGSVDLFSWQTAAGYSTTNMMLYSRGTDATTLIGQASADATITIAPKLNSTSEFERRVGEAWNLALPTDGRQQAEQVAAQGGHVEGRVGKVHWFHHATDGRLAVRVEALEGEVFTVYPTI